MISPHLTAAMAQAKTDDRRRAAAARSRTQPRAQPGRPVASDESVTLRFGSSADEKRLARLAALDSAEPPEQPVLLAEVDGRLLAALALTHSTVIADPFYRTADVIDLLCARARQLDGADRMSPSGRVRSWFRLRLRGCRAFTAERSTSNSELINGTTSAQ